jgi:CheY-like chemotaxis protein
LSLPHLLLVDDSEAVLALESAALAGRYVLSTAADGREALAKAQQIKPAGMLLDLSMPQMRGEEVLRRMAASPELSRIPVIVVSSETERAPECLRAGAKAFLPKPVRAAELLALVSRVLEEARREAERGGMAVLFVSVGTLELGIPIACVKTVLHQLTTRPLPIGPSYLSELAELHGEPVLVLDLAKRLGLSHEQPVQDRKLVVVEVSRLSLALCVDGVRDPEEVPAAALVRREHLQHGPLALMGVARTQRGPVPLVEPSALVSPKLLRELRQSLGAQPASGAA